MNRFQSVLSMSFTALRPRRPYATVPQNAVRIMNSWKVVLPFVKVGPR